MSDSLEMWKEILFAKATNLKVETEGERLKKLLSKRTQSQQYQKDLLNNAEEALLKDNAPALEWLLDHGLDKEATFNKTDRCGSLVQIAAEESSIECISLLVKRGVSLKPSKFNNIPTLQILVSNVKKGVEFRAKIFERLREESPEIFGDGFELLMAVSTDSYDSHDHAGDLLRVWFKSPKDFSLFLQGMSNKQRMVAIQNIWKNCDTFSLEMWKWVLSAVVLIPKASPVLRTTESGVLGFDVLFDLEKSVFSERLVEGLWYSALWSKDVKAAMEKLTLEGLGIDPFKPLSADLVSKRKKVCLWLELFHNSDYDLCHAILEHSSNLEKLNAIFTNPKGMEKKLSAIIRYTDFKEIFYLHDAGVKILDFKNKKEENILHIKEGFGRPEINRNVLRFLHKAGKVHLFSEKDITGKLPLQEYISDRMSLKAYVDKLEMTKEIKVLNVIVKERPSVSTHPIRKQRI